MDRESAGRDPVCQGPGGLHPSQSCQQSHLQESRAVNEKVTRRLGPAARRRHRLRSSAGWMQAVRMREDKFCSEGQILETRTIFWRCGIMVQSARNLPDGIYLCDAARSVGAGRSVASMLTAAVCGVVNYTAFYPTRTPRASPRLCCSSAGSPSLIQANHWLTIHGLQNDLGQAGLWPQAFCKIFQ